MMPPTNELTDRAFALARGVVRTGERLGRHVLGTATGRLHRLRGSAPKDLDDRTLAAKVQTELFRAPGAPKGEVDVMVVDGVVELRGSVRSATASRELEARARAVPEVRDVRSLLTVPGRAAPRARSTASKAKSTAKPATRRRRVNAEAKPTTAGAEPTPAELAAQGKGRRPAPLGSDGDTAAS
jgi:hypothetical protein